MQFTAIRLHSRGGAGREGGGGGVCTERNECLVHIGEALTLRVCLCAYTSVKYTKSVKNSHVWQCLNKFPQQLLCDGQLHTDA